MSLVETILDDESGAQVAGHAGAKVCRSQYWTFDWDRSAWCEGGGKWLPRNARLGHNHACQADRPPRSCTNGDRFQVRIASDGRLEYQGRSTTGLHATGELKRKR